MFLESTCNIDGDWDQLPLVKAVHAINTTVSTLHGVTPMEVVLGRTANEISVLKASNDGKNSARYLRQKRQSQTKWRKKPGVIWENNS